MVQCIKISLMVLNWRNKFDMVRLFKLVYVIVSVHFILIISCILFVFVYQEYIRYEAHISVCMNSDQSSVHCCHQ
jgi:hypothetical protein